MKIRLFERSIIYMLSFCASIQQILSTFFFKKIIKIYKNLLK